MDSRSRATDQRRFRARRCDFAECLLRFPVAEGSPLGELCPLCGHPTRFVDDAYDSKDAPRIDKALPSAHCRLAVLLDNVRSLRNVGSIFRTADGVGAEEILLGGVTPNPDHPGFAKTALGAEHTVRWSAHRDGLRAAITARESGWRLWALEGGPRARPLFAPPAAAKAKDAQILLVLGHEVSGVDPRILELCEEVVFIPMLGHKGSLNVSVAFGIAAYALRFGG